MHVSRKCKVLLFEEFQSWYVFHGKMLVNGKAISFSSVSHEIKNVTTSDVLQIIAVFRAIYWLKLHPTLT